MQRQRPAPGFRSRRLPVAAAIAVIMVGVLQPTVVRAGQEPQAEPPLRPLSLGAAVSIALDRNPLTRASRLDVQRRQLDVEQYENFWNLPSFARIARPVLVLSTN